MKNRRTVIIAFLLIAVMLMGVGYAALTDIFVLSGSAEVLTGEVNKVFDQNIYLHDVKVTTTTGTSSVKDTASISTTDPDNASFSVNSLALKDEYVTFTFTVKNDSEFAATIAVTKDATANTGYFSTTVAFPNGNTIAAGGTLEFTVTTTLVKSVTQTVNASTTIELTATTT